MSVLMRVYIYIYIYIYPAIMITTIDGSMFDVMMSQRIGRRITSSIYINYTNSIYIYGHFII